MPSLNPLILQEVLIQCLKKDNDSRSLGKFMLSGQEPFAVALNYFRKATFVEISENCLHITIKIGKETYTHSISYQFSLINIVMKTVVSSIKEYCINMIPKHFNAIEYFLEQKIENVKVPQSLPEKYRKILATCDFIKKITVNNVFSENALDMIPHTCRELKFQFWYFDNHCTKNVMKISKKYLKNIEKLEIETTCSWQKRHTSSFILNNFPNLQTINALFYYQDEIQYVIDLVKDKKLIYFQKLAKSNITGKITFKNWITRYAHAFSRRLNKPVYEKVLQDVIEIPGVTFDSEEKTITRTVELKKNLIVEFVICFTPQNNDFSPFKN
uniref:Uncharacterized protein n=1 Tax=Panagrolaimus sp. ES5 TaxID=591445 RepID=A0AC34FX59_9BILA